MQALYDGLRSLGVRDARIHAEGFGAASLERRQDDGTLTATAPPAPPAESATITFKRSGQTATWSPAHGSLLALAEEAGLSPPSACRSGHCGSCAMRLLGGAVTYAEPPRWPPAPGEALLCCARPAAGSAIVELDA